MPGTQDLGKLFVRLPVGVLILFHANSFLHGDPGMPSRVAAWGLPHFFIWIGFVMEAGGAILVIVGAYARLGGLLIGAFMICAIVMAHSGLRGAPMHLFLVGPSPVGPVPDHYMLEAQTFYLFGGFAVFLLGAGRLGLNVGGHWN